MPYFNHSMAQGMRRSMLSKTTTGGSGDSSKSANRCVRTMPGGTIAGRKAISGHADPALQKKYTQKISQRKLLFTRSLLKSQIEQLNNQVGALSIDQTRSLFNTYQIVYGNLLHEAPDFKMYEAKNTVSQEFIMMVCIYPASELDPKNSFFLKTLRHLGRKHPYLVHTWEIFHNDKEVYIFQEFVTCGNLVVYLEQHPAVNEAQVCFWAKQIYRALDFLGDNAIAHRNITPNHLVIKAMGKEKWVKLTGFKHAMIYWNVHDNDINFCPCVPISRQKSDGPNFQAPEVYGEQGEVFDPIHADIWSYGANLFYALGKCYPYNVEQPYEQLDEEILHNIQKIPNISKECQNFLYGILRSNANDRIPFDFIDQDPWIKKPYAVTTSQQEQKPATAAGPPSMLPAQLSGKAPANAGMPASTASSKPASAKIAAPGEKPASAKASGTAATSTAAAGSTMASASGSVSASAPGSTMASTGSKSSLPRSPPRFDRSESAKGPSKTSLSGANTSMATSAGPSSVGQSTTVKTLIKVSKSSNSIPKSSKKSISGSSKKSIKSIGASKSTKKSVGASKSTKKSIGGSLSSAAAKSSMKTNTKTSNCSLKSKSSKTSINSIPMSSKSAKVSSTLQPKSTKFLSSKMPKSLASKSARGTWGSREYSGDHTIKTVKGLPRSKNSVSITKSKMSTMKTSKLLSGKMSTSVKSLTSGKMKSNVVTSFQSRKSLMMKQSMINKTKTKAKGGNMKTVKFFNPKGTTKQ